MVLYIPEFLVYPALEICPRELLVYFRLTIGKLQPRALGTRKSDLRSLHRPMKLITEVVLNQIEKSSELFGFERLARDVQVAFPGVQGFSPSNIWRMRACGCPCLSAL